MEKLKTRYYTRAQVQEMGLSLATLDLWSARFRKEKDLFGAPWVARPITERLIHYSEDFVAFLQARQGKTGPSSLPSPDRIMLLFTGTRAGWKIVQFVEHTGDPLAIIQMQLQYFGLEAQNEAQDSQS